MSRLRSVSVNKKFSSTDSHLCSPPSEPRQPSNPSNIPKIKGEYALNAPTQNFTTKRQRIYSRTCASQSLKQAKSERSPLNAIKKHPNLVQKGTKDKDKKLGQIYGRVKNVLAKYHRSPSSKKASGGARVLHQQKFLKKMISKYYHQI